MILQWPGKLT
ncbi:hypothetical protein YPPY61_0761, partial [Yersinia pestis PY-61]